MAGMMKTDPYSLRHLHQRVAHDADQTEFAAMLKKGAVVDAGIYDDRVAGAMDDFSLMDPTVRADWHQHDLELDGAAGRIHEEIERRIRIMGEAYPFVLKEGQVEYRASKNRFYEFCVAICNAPTITQNPYVELPRTFERLSAQIVREYLGCHTEVLHTGSPRDEAVGKSFKQAMVRLHEKSGEWHWGPESGLPSEPPGGDGGVDFVVWKDSLDKRRIGQLFVLGQCACGNDWATKFHDLNLKKLAKWFHPPYLVEPIRAFVTPLHLVDANLTEASREAGLVFDRARLTLIATATNGPESVATWLPKLDELVGLVKDAA